MLRIVHTVAALCLLTACVADPPAEEPTLPLPPPSPPRLQAQRAAPRPAPPANGDAANLAATAAVDAIGAPSEAPPPQPIAATAPTPAPAPTAVATPAPAPPVWRVTRDGVVGCADRSTFIVLNQGADGAPRLLAEARAAGGCRTTFRVNEWAIEATEADSVRLRMTNGGPLTLWFRRSEVVAP